jgi:hypothetical protein
MITIGCGMSHKDMEHTPKCSNKKTAAAQKQYDYTRDKYFFTILQKTNQK